MTHQHDKDVGQARPPHTPPTGSVERGHSAGLAQADADLTRRRLAAERYSPAVVDCLLIAEAPPSAPERYFYFEHVRDQDSLFRHVVAGILGYKPERQEKAAALLELKRRGFFLIDLSEHPVVSGADLSANVPGLVLRVRDIAPRKIILIKANVFDLAYGPLTREGLPVVRSRIPFPGSGQQARFRLAFADALMQSPVEGSA